MCIFARKINMAEHNLMGKAGEDAAAKYLEKHDYAIRHRNWHYHHLEIDMVAVKDNEIIFVEVKTRKNSDYGEPYEAVDDKKAKYLMRAADTYIKLYQLDNSIRFDILSLTSIDGMQDFEIKHIKEAFYPTMTKSL
jgi:putative endonuclease